MREKVRIDMEPRTSDEELLLETMPEAVTEEKQKLLADSEIAQEHGAHLERGLEIAELKEHLTDKSKDAEAIQQEIDQIKDQIAEKEQRIISKILEFTQIIRLKRELTSKEASGAQLSEEVEKVRKELQDLEVLHSTTKAELDTTVSSFLSSESVTTDATNTALEAKKEEIDRIREARDVAAMCERENCLVFHTLMEKSYFPGTDFKTAPTDNSPLNYEKAAAGGIQLVGDIAVGYDIELSCSTIREGTDDAIWKGAGGFVINSGSARIASDADLGSQVDKRTGRRYTISGLASETAWLQGRSDNKVRNEEDLHLAVTGPARDIKGNHNELVIESPKYCAVFINLPSDGNIIFYKEGQGDEFVEEYHGFDGRPMITESKTQELIEIGEKYELPVYGIYRGKAYKVGPGVQRITQYESGIREKSHPFRERSFHSVPVSFEEIRKSGISVSEKNKQTARERVPEDVFL